MQAMNRHELVTPVAPRFRDAGSVFVTGRGVPTSLCRHGIGTQGDNPAINQNS
jgi:hypothetical protein